MASDRVDLYLICGFLGSGKTTFLKNLLDSGQTARTGVLVNEFSSTGIDGKLLAGYDIPLLEIRNGSIFCACLSGGFVKSLAAFLCQPIDRLYVEASGLADPSSMEKLLEQMEPYTKKRYPTNRRYCYRGSICVVDAVQFPKLCGTMVAAGNQVRKSSLILFNKIDKVSKEQADRICSALRTLNPGAEIIRTSFARVPFNVMSRSLHAEENSEAESSNTYDTRILSGVFHLDGIYPRKKMETFLKQIAPMSLRIKGFFRDDEGVWTVSGVGDTLEIQSFRGPVPDSMEIVCLSSRKASSEEQDTDHICKAWQDVFGTECPYERD